MIIKALNLFLCCPPLHLFSLTDPILDPYRNLKTMTFHFNCL